MPYTATESTDSVVLAPQSAANAAVIWLHGLGANGFDFVPIVDELRLPATLAARFVFPHARERPVTINNGYVMRAWYDVKGFGPERLEDEAGIRDSEVLVRKLIAAETVAGIPAKRIVVAGFSQGGAIALQTGLRYSERLAGIMALSTYLPLAGSVAREASAANRDVPLLMCHGLYDPIVPAALGTQSRDLLTQLGYQVSWKTYPMEHNVSAAEITDISAWLQQVLTAR